MERSKFLVSTILVLAVAVFFSAGDQALAQSPADMQPQTAAQAVTGDASIPANECYGKMRCITPAMREAAAARAAAARATQPAQIMPASPVAGGTPDYFGIYPNYANSPRLRKFVDTLPGLGPSNSNNLGQYLPIAVADTATYPGSDYYRIGVVDYTQKMHSDLPATTKLRGYKDLNPAADGSAHYLGPVIVAQRNKPVRIKFTNMLGTGAAGDLFIPVDTSVMGAGMGPDGSNYTQNRANLHLHGGFTPWISDGTPHQWTVPAGDATTLKKGMSTQDVPDMPAPGDGSMTFFYPNQQSNRLMFYHDHSYGITRLNVYAGEAAGYLLTDPVEDRLIDSGILPNLGGVYRYGIPLIIQDKTFVPDPASLAAQDPTWNWGPYGNLWFPHVYIPNQNPADPMGVNAMGRWDYGPWFWPPVTTLAHMPIVGNGTNGCPVGLTCPATPNPSLVPEGFMDTPLVNGTAYPVLAVQRKPYRFRILNASNDRFWNLQLYYATTSTGAICKGASSFLPCTEVAMVPAVPHPGVPTWPATWPTDGRDGGVPDPTTAGPAMIQIGSEGGFLPAPVVLPNTPVGYEYNRRSIVVLNVTNTTLFLGPAERADVIIDFSQVPDGSKIMLYNDAPAPVPAFDPRNDYYTGDPDQRSTGGAPTTLAGFGPNTRTIMRFDVGGLGSAPFSLAALQTAFASSSPSPGAVKPGAFASSQDMPIVPQAAYGSAYNTTFTDTYSRIQDTSLTFTPVFAAAPITVQMLPKAIQELFELDYGRMNATLGVELPFTNFNTQTTIPLGYADPLTETISTSAVSGPPTSGDNTQIWKITHNGVDTHAIHFHLFNVQLINRVGWDGQIVPPDPNEVGWKETVRMNPLQDAIVALRPTAPVLPFTCPNSNRPLDVTQPVGATISVTDPATGNAINVVNAMTDFGWEYVWHCHLLGHEENDMMRPIKVQVASTGTHSISGTVTTPGLSGPVPVPFVTMTLSGSAAATATTDFQGNYTFTGLANGNYTVTPGAATYAFTPLNRAVTMAGVNVTGVNFSATYVPSPTYTISGTITAGASALAGVTVTLSGAAAAVTTTDVSGNYSFTGLPNGAFTVTPGLTGYAFNPVNRAVTVSAANVTGQNFAATATATYSISGNVSTNTGFGLVPLSGVTITLSGAAGAVTTTDINGNFTLTGLGNGAYTVTPSRTGYIFSPVNRAVTISGANVTGQSFTAAVSGGGGTYSVSGTVRTAGGGFVPGVPVPGVTITLSGAAAAAAVTDANGNYTFSGLVNGGYAVTPSLAGFTFAPVNRAVTVNGASVSGQDFTRN